MMKQKLTLILCFLLFVFGNTFSQNLTVIITQTNSETTTVTQAETLGAAVGSLTLTEISKIEITAGSFNTSDWLWLRDNKTTLTNLTNFIITDNLTLVADLPDTDWDNPLFNNKLQNISVAKVDVIGEYAFYDCESLTTANFPLVTIIGNFAFLSCTGLTTADFPLVNKINFWAFAWCISLITTDFHLVTFIGENAFENCTSLTTANFPLATNIGNYAFYNCTSLITSNFPLVTNIDFCTFNNCESLTIANFPLVTNIGKDAFKNCYKLSTLMVGQNPPNVETNAFYNCPVNRCIIPVNPDGILLTGQDLENAVNNYLNHDDGNTNDSLWYGWGFSDNVYTISIDTAITNGTIDVNKYGASGFDIAFTTLPANGYTFAYAWYITPNGDTTIITGNTFTMPGCNITLGAYFPKLEVFVTVNDTLQLYGLTLASALANTNPATINKLEVTGGIFMNTDWLWLRDNNNILTNLTGFIITNNLTFVADLPNTDNNNPLFNSKLQYISVAKVKAIGNYVFYNCTSLKTINFPLVTGIGNRAFNYCNKLSTFMVGQNPPTVGIYVFYDCPATRYIIPVNQNGILLAGQDLENAVNNYINHDDGNTNDSLWYGWTISNNIYSITLDNTITNGTIDVEKYCVADVDVTYTALPASGYAFAYAWYTTPNGDTEIISGNSFTMPGCNITLNAYFPKNEVFVTVNDTLQLNGLTLASALASTNPATINKLEVTGGIFMNTDWLWLRANKNKLTNLTNFIISYNLSLVANLPDTYDDNPLFNNKLQYISVAKATYIGNNAFNNCTALTEASFSGATTIGSSAFYLCRSLTKFSAGNVSFINNHALYGCSNLQNIELNGVKTVGEYAFAQCTRLFSINFYSATTINNYAFFGCISLEHVNLQSVKSIGEYAFASCKLLTNIKMPNVNNINESAFESCNKLTTVNIPRILNIGRLAFDDCQMLSNLMAGQNPPTVGNYAFFNNSINRLLVPVDTLGKELQIAERIEVINKYKAVNDGDTTNQNWYGWQLGHDYYTITLDESVGNDFVNISKYALSGQTVNFTVTSFQYSLFDSAWYTTQTGLIVPIKNNSFVMPAENIVLFVKFKTRIFNVSINDTLNIRGFSLESALFNVDLTNISSLKITGGIFNTADWWYLFDIRNKLTNIINFSIVDTVEINDQMPPFNSALFNNNIQFVDISNIITLPKNVFSQCSSLKSVTFNKVIILPYGCFQNCSSLTTVNCPNIEYIDHYAFNGCSSIELVTFNKVKSLQSYCFQNCSSLTTVNCPNIEYIDRYAFNGCSSIEWLNLKNVSHICIHAFDDCVKLNKIFVNVKPPVVDGIFYNCAPQRNIIIVNAFDDELNNAYLAYKAVNDGNTTDNLWYGWNISTTDNFYKLEVLQNDMGQVNASCYGLLPLGTVVQLDAIPNSGYKFIEGSMRAYNRDNNTEVEITNGKLTMPDYNVYVEAKFEKLVGININNKQNVAVYPNPATNQLNISGFVNNQIINIYSITGVKVLSGTLQPGEPLNIEHLKHGVYILKVDNNIIKFIKN